MNYQKNPLAQRTCRYPMRQGQGMPCADRTEQAPEPPCKPLYPEAPSACRCKECISGKSLAMVYAACQDFDGLYSPEQGLCQGTLFAALDKPFRAGGM